jgi:hypothetical protein
LQGAGLRITSQFTTVPAWARQKTNEAPMGKKLYAGDIFPDLTVNVAGGGSFDLKSNLEANYNIVLFYRGHW